jgi:hypothetical protein
VNALLSTKQVADMLGVDRHAVAEFVAKGYLDVVRLPGYSYPKFTPEAVRAFIERHQSSGPESGPIEGFNDGIIAQASANSALVQFQKARRVKGSKPHEWRRQFAKH